MEACNVFGTNVVILKQFSNLPVVDNDNVGNDNDKHNYIQGLFQRLVTFEICDQSDEETYSGQQKDNNEDKYKDNDNDNDNDKYIQRTP